MANTNENPAGNPTVTFRDEPPDRDERVSLYGVDPEDAVRALLGARPSRDTPSDRSGADK